MQVITLTITDKTVSLPTVLEQIRSMPVVEVKPTDFALIPNEERPSTAIPVDELVYARRSKNFEEENEMASVYQYQGKYIVVTGKTFIGKMIEAKTPIFKVRLISKHALKHLQTIETPAPKVVVPIAQPNPAFMRDPGYQDRRPDGPTRPARQYNNDWGAGPRNDNAQPAPIGSQMREAFENNGQVVRQPNPPVRRPATAAGMINNNNRDPRDRR